MKSEKNPIKESQGALEVVDEEVVSADELPERICTPEALNAMHDVFCDNDSAGSKNRAAVQELVDFVPPIDPQELISRGQGDRFNVNHGIVAAIKNEAVGAYLDIFTSPPALVKIALQEDYDMDVRDQHAAIMSDEFTKMIRNWDGWIPQVLSLADIFVTHGVAIPWWDDCDKLFFNVSGLEDFKFDNETKAVSSMVEVTTIEREVSVSDLYEAIEDHLESDAETTPEGWNIEEVRQAIIAARPKDLADDDHWNFEAAERRVKANRFGTGNELAMVCIVWGFVKELDGRISIYAARKTDKRETEDIDWNEYEEGGLEFILKKRFAFEDANQAFLIFPFSTGNLNIIHTIRGLGYPLYEAGQADNILRNKLMDAARARSTDVYTASGGFETAEDINFIDVGHGMIAPDGLQRMPEGMTMPLDKSIGFALEQNQTVLDRHSGGLANSQLLNNPGARRNEMQVAAELDHMNQMLSFAISLFYAPYEKFLKELVRRAFTKTQKDLIAASLVKEMKQNCKARGVPEDAFNKIDFYSTTTTRISGAGSRSSRLLMFNQMTQFYAEMPAIGQEYFRYDFITELGGVEKAERYFGTPGTRKDHIDMSLIQLENARLHEGDFLDPVDGENKMLHLAGHIQDMEEGLQGVDQGLIPLDGFTMENVAMFKHITDTLDQTSVHETRIPELNRIRQRIQQIGEIMDNGFRMLAAKQRRGEPINQMPAQDGEDPAAAAEQQAQEQFQREEARKDQEHQNKLYRIFQEGMARLEVYKQAGQAKVDLEQQKAMAKIALMDVEAAGKMRRDRILGK